MEALIEHWRQHGLPDYAQFDNDTVFQGAHQWPDTFGRVTRLCLQLGVTPVFTPPREAVPLDDLMKRLGPKALAAAG